MARPALTPKDGQILDLLAQVCHIAERRGLGSRSDVARIAWHALPRVADPRLAVYAQRAREAERRAERAEADVRRLQELVAAPPPPDLADGVWQPPKLPTLRIIEASPRTVRALDEMCSGASIRDVAAHLGLTYSSAVNLLNKAAHTVGASDRAQAVALATSGAVKVRVRKHGNRKEVA